MNEIDPPQNPIQAVTHADPIPYYRALVDGRPFAFDDSISMWVASSAEAVTAVLTDDLCRVRPPAEPVPRALAGSPSGEIFGRLVRMVDAPAHDGLKAAISEALGGIDTASFAARCDHWAAALLDERDPSAYAFQLPAVVMGDLIGVAGDKLDALAGWVGDFVRGISPLADATRIAQGNSAARDLTGLIAGLPGPLGPEASRHGIDQDTLVANRIGFLSQAYEATAGLIGNTLIALARRPELAARAIEDSALLSGVVAETLRADAPVQNTRRVVAAGGIVAGEQVQVGDAILIVLAAANLDPAANANPEIFDAQRQDPKLFTFGVGPHACPSQMLASAIAVAGVRRMLSTGVDLPALLSDFTYQPSANVRIPIFGAAGRSDSL